MQMVFVLALISAAVYGAADFIGGIASRRAAVLTVVTVAQGTGLILLAMLMPLLPTGVPTRLDLFWGAAAGLAGGLGVAWLYRALAIGTMAIVAPITAVCAVLIPVAAGLLQGDRLNPITGVGIATALLSVVLVSQSPAAPGEARRARQTGVPRGLGIALLSGIAIGFFFLGLAQTRAEAQMWPLLAARAASTVVFAAAVLATRGSVAVPRPALRLAVAGGALDMLANALYLLAARRGALSTVVTLVSLYPASTVLLARFLLHEQFSRLQGAGIFCALAAVLVIVGSS